MFKKILSVGSLVVGMIGVQPSQAQNFNQERLVQEIAGDYAFKDPDSGEHVIFSVDKQGQIKLEKNSIYLSARIEYLGLANEAGSHAPVTANLIFSGGSDEDVYNLILRVFLVKNGWHQKLKLVDTLLTHSDGPNGILSYKKLPEFQLAPLNARRF
jgi:hypothetical protein